MVIFRLAPRTGSAGHAWHWAIIYHKLNKLNKLNDSRMPGALHLSAQDVSCFKWIFCFWPPTWSSLCIVQVAAKWQNLRTLLLALHNNIGLRNPRGLDCGFNVKCVLRTVSVSINSIIICNDWSKDVKRFTTRKPTLYLSSGLQQSVCFSCSFSILCTDVQGLPLKLL